MGSSWDRSSPIASALAPLWSTLVEVMKIMVTSLKKCHDVLPHSVLPTLQQAITDPRLHRRLLDTHRQVWGSLLWDHCSFLLVLVCTRFCCAPREPISQSCVSSGSPMVRLMATSSKRAYAILKLLHPEPLCLHQTTTDQYLPRRHPNTVLSQSLWGPWVQVRRRCFWALWASLAGMGFDSKHDFAPPAIFLGLLLCPWTWGISSLLVQWSPAAAPDLGHGISPLCHLLIQCPAATAHHSSNVYSLGEKLWPT